MNDPEIIRKLEEIKEELSGIKNEANWIANVTKMNDPKIIDELENIKWELSGIKQELSGIKDEVNWIPKAFLCMLLGICLAAWLDWLF